MVARIKLRQFTKGRVGPLFVVVHEVLEADSIPSSIFVVNSKSDQYSHVATYQDMLSYPDNKKESVEKGLGFYRVNCVERSWHSALWVTKDVELIEKRVQLLVNEWPIMTTHSVDQTVTISSVVG